MPITGKTLYHLRWWYRASVTDDQSADQIRLKKLAAQAFVNVQTPTVAITVAADLGTQLADQAFAGVTFQ